MPSVKIHRVSKNGGIKALGTRSKDVSGVGVFVGHDRSSGKYPKGQSVAQVGSWNARGTDRIPARNYLKKLVEQYREKYKKALAALAKNFLLGRFDKDKANRNLATRGVRELKLVINEFDTPPNAPSTIRRKGFDNPLIHTKKFLKSIIWKPAE